MNISFLGATETVTGSKYLLTLENKKILIDCGLFQGYKEIRLRNWNKLPINPHEIDAVILTHAHLDHTGYLPLLVKNGFKGPIYATLGTKELCALLLPDSGHLQEDDAYFANKHHFSKHSPALPLYTEAEARKVMKQFVTVPFETHYSLYADCHFIFSRAAHILGASFIQFTYKGSTIVFSGDMGRRQDPIMREPAIIESADYLVIESTYGNRLHSTVNPEDELAAVINQTAAHGGITIIPAFAVGRTQSILYHISQLKEKDRIPDLPVFLDSPMAEDVTDIYIKHINEHLLNAKECAKLNATVTYITTAKESKELDKIRFPSIIISASGMITGGRVLHHLKAFVTDKRNAIIFAGYQAEGTRGDRILKGEKMIKIHGQMIPIRASVHLLSNLSAHADYSEILTWLKHFKKAPKQVFITHGEPEAAESLKQKIKNQLGWNCIIPHYLQTMVLS